jgi:hypothetical protein
MAENGPIELGIKINADQATRDIEKFSKQSGRALTSLSLVLQDLPFGFIGIQNNLPGLITAFGQLDTKTNGVRGVLKELGSALVGAGGLYLAFSAVTSIATLAIKEYGSIGAAFEALVGKTNKYAESVKKANELQKEFLESSKTIPELQNQASGSYEASGIKLQALSKIVLDETRSQKERKNALEQIKELDKDRFKNFDLEKTSLTGLIGAVDDYTNSLIANAVAKQYESEIAKTTINLNTQREALFKLQKQLDDINSRYPDLAKQAEEYNNTTKKFTIPKEIEDYRNLLKTLKEKEKLVTEVEFPRFEELRKQFEDAIGEVNKYYSIGGKGKGGGKKGNALKVTIDTQDLDAAFNLDKIISNVTKYGNVLLDTNNSVKERKEALKELIAINPQVFSALTLEKNGLAANKLTIEEYTRSLAALLKERQFDARASQLNTEFRNAEIKSQEDAIKLDIDRAASIANLTTTQDQYGNSTDKITAKALAFTKALGQQQEITEAINKALNNIYGAGTAEEDDPVKRIEGLAKQIKTAKNTFENTIANGLQRPFTDFFDTLLEDGKIAFDSFEGLFKDLLKNIAAQLISAGIAKLLSSLLFPQAAAADALGAAAAGGGANNGIFGLIISLFNRKSAFNNVDFGGVNGGAMQMAGAVNLTLRGSDLVASINRTNTTINRVG